MRRLSLVVAAVALAACGPKEQPATDTSAAAAPPPPGISLSDVAGAWTAKVMRMDSDSVILTYDLTASADPTA